MKQKLTLLFIAILLISTLKLNAQYRMGYEFGLAKPLNDISDNVKAKGGYSLVFNYIYEDFEAGDLIFNVGFDQLNFDTDNNENVSGLGFIKFGGGFAYNLIEPEDYVFQAKAMYNYSYQLEHKQGIHDLGFGVSGGLDRIRLNLMFHLPLNSLEWEKFDHNDNVTGEAVYIDTKYKPSYITLSLMYVSGF